MEHRIMFKSILNMFSNGNHIKVDGIFTKGKNCKIRNSKINIGPKGKLVIGDHVTLTNYSITVIEGECFIGDQSFLEQGNSLILPSIFLNKGKLSIGHHAIIRAEICVRFSGQCSIGNYTGIMEQSELRCDESLSIGDFNMISYECMIYDTNTHVSYPAEKRREMTQRDYPNMGLEIEKPVTAPVIIGNDCWMGKRSVVLKGCSIGDKVTIAACAVVTKDIPAGHLAYGNPAVLVPKS